MNLKKVTRRIKRFRIIPQLLFVVIVFTIASNSPGEVALLFFLPPVGMPIFEDLAQVQSRINRQKLGIVDDPELEDGSPQNDNKGDSELPEDTKEPTKDRDSQKESEDKGGWIASVIKWFTA